MPDTLDRLFAQFGIAPGTLALMAFGMGIFLAIVTVLGAVARPDPVSGRMRALSRRPPGTAEPQSGTAILRDREAVPRGLMRAFVPDKPEERSVMRRQLRQAGFRGANAVRNFFLLRTALGLGLPALLLAPVVLRDALAPGISGRFAAIGETQLFILLGALLVIGFYGPQIWLRQRMAARLLRIEEHFPNTLDLLQISVEAGMGLDAAMNRVAREMAHVAPEISEEFLAFQNEIMAGRDRQAALLDMARRLAIEDAMALVNVIIQSIQYGTSVSESLMGYSEEMRLERELRAQEKANRLPVQMSGVIAGLMLPALLLITLGPMIIRLIRAFGEM